MSRRHPIQAFGVKKAQPGDIRVERLEARLQPRIPFPHQHDFYHFLYVEKGSGWHEIDFTRHRVGRDQIYLVLPGQVHAWKLAAATTRGFVLEFNRESLSARGEVASRLLVALEDVPSKLEGDEARELKTLFEELFSESENQELNSSLCLESLTLVLLARLARLGASPAKALRSSVADRFLELVERHFSREHSVEFYAGRLGLSAKALTLKVTKVLGRSAGAVIHERCLLEAKRLLSYSDLSIAEIGYQIGFEDPNYFARFFKRRTGASPGEFRRLASRSVSRGRRT